MRCTAYLRVRARHDPRAHIGRSRGSRGGRKNWRAAQETRCREASRNRRKRCVWPQIRCGNGAALQCQPANRIANPRRASRQHIPGMKDDMNYVDKQTGEGCMRLRLTNGNGNLLTLDVIRELAESLSEAEGSAK